MQWLHSVGNIATIYIFQQQSFPWFIVVTVRFLRAFFELVKCCQKDSDARMSSLFFLAGFFLWSFRPRLTAAKQEMALNVFLIAGSKTSSLYFLAVEWFDSRFWAYHDNNSSIPSGTTVLSPKIGNVVEILPRSGARCRWRTGDEKWCLKDGEKFALEISQLFSFFFFLKDASACFHSINVSFTE